jgi:putative ABC transport system permease protein
MGQGLQNAITGQFGRLSVDRLTIQNKGTGFGPPGSTVVEKLNDDDLKIIERVGGIDAVIPRLIRVGELEYNEVSGFGYATDVPMDKDNMKLFYETLGAEIEIGKLLDSNDLGKVLLGNYFLETNDFKKPFEVGKDVRINDKSFEIIGFLKQSSSFTTNSVVYMLSRDLEDLLDIEGEYDLIVVKVEDKDEVEDIAEEIREKLREDRDEEPGEESFSVNTPIQSLESVNTILGIVNIIVIGIAMISLLVGGIGIANTMYTSVVERTKEIGVMKAIGAQNKDVLIVFLIEAGLLGLTGGIAGALFGIGAAFAISEIANQLLGPDVFLVTISYPLMAGAILFSFLVGVISGILPARQASKLNVVDALRN